MMHGAPFPMVTALIVVAILLAAMAVAITYLMRNAPGSARPVAELVRDRHGFLALPQIDAGSGSSAPDDIAADTIFILPDISNYTRFMTGSHFSTGHAQHIIFCLINVMIEAATRTVELSKLEGDAALFYADARAHAPERIGATVMDIFAAFFRERERLIESNICKCHACSSITMLDLKIFLHRGRTARFTFRGSVDHFGTDVIVIHRIMKNGVKSKRYVIVTDAAANCVSLPDDLPTYRLEEKVEHVGEVQATVYEINDDRMSQMSGPDMSERPSVVKSTRGKLAQNLRSLRNALGQGRSPG